VSKQKGERIRFTVVYESPEKLTDEQRRDVENYLRRLHHAHTVRGAGPGGVWRLDLAEAGLSEEPK
jgi:hypothetical protein